MLTSYSAPWSATASVRREALAAAGVSAATAALLAWAGPPGSDFAAHAYQRALFLEHGFTFWNNFWYAGHYTFVTYSFLYYPLAAALGIRLLAVATVAAAALAFAVVVLREWGPAARWSSRSFAVVWAGIVLSAAFPFALGAALALLALWALQANARWRFAILASLALAASPLAFLILALLVAAIALVERPTARAVAVPIASLAALGSLVALLGRLFPDPGRYPFSTADLIAVCLFSGLGAALTWSAKRGRLLSVVLLVYGAACVTVYLMPSALGSNIIRLQYLAVPIAVLVVSVRLWRPLPVCVAAVLLAGAWNARPLIRSFTQDVDNSAASQAYWQPAIRFLRTHLSSAYRVEAVDTVGHWPSLYLAAQKIPLARGWFRQDDFPTNVTLYERLTAAGYVTWLRDLGVRYVVLSNAQPDYSARAEARLLASGSSGLRTAMRTPWLTIFAVPAPSAILTGAPGARVVEFSQARIVLRVDRPGRYRLAVRFSPYWHSSSGCLTARPDGMTDVVARRPGRIVVSFDVDPAAAFATLVGRATTCRNGDRGSPAS